MSGRTATLSENEWAVIFNGLQFAGQRMYLLDENQAEALLDVTINLISQIAVQGLMAQIESQDDEK